MTEPVTQSPPARSSGGGWWATVREALRGSRHDYTSGPLGRAIVLLAIPMVAEMIMESLFAVWDVYWVGRVGPGAQATVGLTESLLTLIYTAAMGLSIGVTAMVARRIGEKNLEGAAEAAVQGIALGVIVAVVTGAIGVAFAPRLLALMGASPEVLTIGSTYARIMLGGNVVILLLFLINAVFRGAGDAAIATTIGRGTGVLYQLYRLWRGDARVSIRRVQLTLQPAVMRTMLRLSGTGTFQVLIGTASWIFLVRIISSFGTDAIAGYQIAIRIIVFALLPSWGLANAAATLVGQNLGAGRPERGERAVWLAGFYNMLCLGGVGALFVVFAGPITGVFTRDPGVAPIAAQCLRTISYGFLFYAWGMVITQSFNGAGDTWTPTWINLGCFWLWEIPLAYVLAVNGKLGPFGVALAVTIAFSTVAVVSALLFRRGRWKERRV